MYVGNDSFGSHVTSQSGIKSLVILLDTPKAYTDYSKNYQRIIPDGIEIENITHGSNLKAENVSVEKVYQAIINKIILIYIFQNILFGFINNRR